MLKRYLVLGAGLCFMSIGIIKCPFITTGKSSATHVAQVPAVVQQAAVTQSATPRS